MTRICAVSTLAIGLLLAFGSRSAVGQIPASLQGTVGGTGVEVIKRQPDTISMQLALTATGKDLKDALAKLKARREAALKVCTDLGAAADTLSVGAPRIAPDMSQRQRMGYANFPASRTSRTKKPEAAPPVNVSAWLTAEWPLKGSDAEELLIASQSLRDKLKSELVKSAPKPDLSPEQEEMAEEAAQQMGNDGTPKPGDPVFVFVAKVSNADYVKAAAKAFAMAKAHAQRLADAAGSPLGELRSVQGNDQDRQSLAMMNYQRQYYNNGMLQEEDMPEQSGNTDEATGTNPAEVRLTIAIAASFALGK